MAEFVKIRGLDRRGVRIGGLVATNAKTIVVDLDDARTRRDVSRHSAIGALFSVGETDVAIESGAVVTPGTTTTVSISAGVIGRDYGADIAIAAAANQAVTVDATNPRWVLVSADKNSGATTVTLGTPAATPVLPATPTDDVVLAQVYVPAAAASSAAYTITDVAPRLA